MLCGNFLQFRTFSTGDLRAVLKILHTPYIALHTLAQYFLGSSSSSNFWVLDGCWGKGWRSGRRFTHLCQFFLQTSLQGGGYGLKCRLHCTSKAIKKYWNEEKLVIAKIFLSVFKPLLHYKLHNEHWLWRKGMVEICRVISGVSANFFTFWLIQAALHFHDSLTHQCPAKILKLYDFTRKSSNFEH